MEVNFKKPIYKKLLFFLLAILCCFSILPNAIQSIVIVVFIAFALWYNFKSIKGEIAKRGIKILIITISWIIVLAISIFYSIEYNAGLIVLQKLVNIIILPFVILFCYPNLGKKKIEILMIVFVLSNLVFAFYLIFYLFQNISILLSQDNIANYNYSEIIWHGIKHGFTPPFLIHKTYFSMNMLLSMFFLIWYLINKDLIPIKKALICLCLFFLACVILFFLSTVNVLLMLILPVIFIIAQKSIRKRVIFLSSYFFILCFLLLLVVNIFNTYNKDIFLKNTLNKKLHFIENIFVTNSLNYEELDKRALIHECAKKLIKEKPFFGYGLGEQHIHLTGCYASKKDFVLYNGNYNSHNYYYFLMLSGGLLALLPFLFMILWLIQQAFFQRNILLMVFLIIVFSNLLIENTFSRINGVLFFAIFLPILFRFKENHT